MPGQVHSSIQHNIPLIPQPTSSTCWAAATAMLIGASVATVRARTPADLVTSGGGLKNYSSRDDWLTGTRRYAAIFNLKFSAPMSWSLGALYQQLQGGPMMFDMLWRADQYASGAGSPGHMICVIGIGAEGGTADSNVTLTVNDPWPPNKGKVETVNAYSWLAQVPTRTYRVFWNA